MRLGSRDPNKIDMWFAVKRLKKHCCITRHIFILQFTELRDLAEKEGVCISAFHPVPRSPKQHHFKAIVTDILATKSRGMVYVTGPNVTLLIALTMS